MSEKESSGTESKRRSVSSGVTTVHPGKRRSFDKAPVTAKGETALLALRQPDKALAKAISRMLFLQHPQGYWVFELEADTTIPSEYIMLQRFLGRNMAPELGKRLGRYLLDKQLVDGGWPLYAEDGMANISTSTKAYFALKLLGHPPQAAHMVRARLLILSLGGAAACNVFTRITLALFGQIPWHTPPAMPVEIMLLPRWFFFHLSKVSYWSRTVIVPLLILYAKRAVCCLRPQEGIPELFVCPPDKIRHLDLFFRGHWRENMFILLDRLLKRVMRHIPKRIHAQALQRAERWTREHMGGVGGIGAIFPAMANAVMALKALGYPKNDPDYVRGLKAVDDLLIDRFAADSSRCPPDSPNKGTWTDQSAALDPQFIPYSGLAATADTSICQPCNSPVWDTCLALSAMLEAGIEPQQPAVVRCIDWLLQKQIQVKGDWSLRAPDLEPGGWAFQFENTLYPDVDDTAMVVMALLRAGALDSEKSKSKIAKAVNWVIGMQSSDGGWAAFDIDNNQLYLNDIPFADHGALLDPSTCDLTARSIEMLAMLGYRRNFGPIARGIDFLVRRQEPTGAWHGRWGVNYIYGTWSVLCGLERAGEDMSKPYVRKAVAWLKACQNADNGWGETCYSYDAPRLAGQGCSTPSQTAWSLLGLMAAGEVDSLAVQRGIRYLLEHQNRQGGWDEKHFTGTGFPRVFYLRYHGYSQYFPLWALGVYARTRAGKMSRQAEVTLKTPAELHLPVLEKRPC